MGLIQILEMADGSYKEKTRQPHRKPRVQADDPPPPKVEDPPPPKVEDPPPPKVEDPPPPGPPPSTA
jgi:hypothetical protein